MVKNRGKTRTEELKAKDKELEKLRTENLTLRERNKVLEQTVK